MSIPRRLVGRGAQATWLNALRDFVESIQIRQGVGYTLDQGPHGTMLDIDQGGGGGGSATIKMFHVRFVYDEYLCGVEWDGTQEINPESSLHYIALPHDLRTVSGTTETILGATHYYFYSGVPDDEFNHYRFDSPTNNASDPNGEWQIVTKAWYQNEIIHAIKCKTDAVYDTQNNTTCPWLYMLPARQWTKRQESE